MSKQSIPAALVAASTRDGRDAQIDFGHFSKCK
jgi:hypothetical protein